MPWLNNRAKKGEEMICGANLNLCRNIEKSDSEMQFLNALSLRAMKKKNINSAAAIKSAIKELNVTGA